MSGIAPPWPDYAELAREGRERCDRCGLWHIPDPNDRHCEGCGARLCRFQLLDPYASPHDFVSGIHPVLRGGKEMKFEGRPVRICGVVKIVEKVQT